MGSISKGVLAATLCLLISGTAYAGIDSVSPAQIPFGNVEEFLTIHGSDLAGSASTVVVFDGQDSIEANNADATTVIVWIPEAVLFVEGRHSVEVVATDSSGDVRRSGLAYFTVSSAPGPGDDGPPFISVPEVVIAEAATRSGAFVHFEVIGTSRSGATAPVACNHESGSFFPFGSTSVTCTATDAFGSTSGSFLVVVSDTTPPVVTVPADFTSPTATVTYTASAVDALDGEVAVSCNPPSGSVFSAGTTVVACVAYDASFNLGYAAFRVTTNDGVPTLTLPDDLSAEATSAAGAVVTFTATATGGATVACNPASGSTFPLGDTLVTCTATNASGSTSGSFTITVFDGPPTLTLPADITAEATSPAGAAVTYTATAEDAVDGQVTITCTPPSGSTFPFGTTTVNCSASDSQGHETTGEFDVTVQDTTPPNIVLLEATPALLWPPDHRMVNVQINAVVWDAADLSPVTQIVSVQSNQPVNGTGDGDTAPDWKITGPLTLELRAERAGSADRIYTITVSSTDDAGNIGQRTVEVRVAQTRRRR